MLGPDLPMHKRLFYCCQFAAVPARRCPLRAFSEQGWTYTLLVTNTCTLLLHEMGGLRCATVRMLPSWPSVKGFR